MEDRQEIYTYRKIVLSKKNGSFRNIYIPDKLLKKHLKTLLKPLIYIYERNHTYDCDHAFFKGKNCVTNASNHIKSRYVLSLDIKDFFDNITSKHLEKYIPEDILYFILINGALPQGYLTSPYAANIAVMEFDRMIVQRMRSFDSNIIYTRYADDLTFSFNNKDYSNFIVSEIIKICHYFSFRLNTNKIRLQDKNNGRAIVTGVGVSYYNVHPTRKTLKKLRAARHQGNEAQAKGLAEWASCKLPRN